MEDDYLAGWEQGRRKKGSTHGDYMLGPVGPRHAVDSRCDQLHSLCGSAVQATDKPFLGGQIGEVCAKCRQIMANPDH